MLAGTVHAPQASSPQHRTFDWANPVGTQASAVAAATTARRQAAGAFRGMEIGFGRRVMPSRGTTEGWLHPMRGHGRSFAKYLDGVPNRLWPTVRVPAGALAGLAATLLLVVGIEAFGLAVHPFPEDFQGSHEEICAHVARYPPWLLAVVIGLWALAAGTGTLVARAVGGNRVAPAIVGALILAALALNLSMLPYPWWFKAGTAVAVLAAMARPVARPDGRW